MAVAALAVAALLSPSGAARAAGDATHGKTVFNQCLVCHTIEPGKWKIGPSLWGVIGRPAASLTGFQYSAAMKTYAETTVNKDGAGWTDEKLNVYLEAPMQIVKGTKMAFAGLKNQKDRDDVIAYLNTLK